MAVRMDFACNDPDNGNFMGMFSRLEVTCGDIEMTLEGPWNASEGVRLKFSGEIAYIGRIRVPILDYRQWYGNWCWDAIWVRWPSALKIINYLPRLKAQGWHMSEGPSSLYEAFNQRGCITPQEWEHAR